MPPAAKKQPRVDDHVVEPGEWRELHDGVVVEVQPAKAPHARTQMRLGYVLESAVVPGYGVDGDLLTRTSNDWDFASDVCVRKDGMDPESECRYLEELAFEVNDSQSERSLRNKAQQMSDRGVRRVFVIDVSDAEGGTMPRIDGVREWVGEGWRSIGMDDVIEDPCLEQPLAIRALCDALEADNAVVRALAAKNNPVIAEIAAENRAEGVEQGEQKGLARGMQRSIRAVLEHRGIAISTAHDARLHACEDPAVLDAWLKRAFFAPKADDVFG